MTQTAEQLAEELRDLSPHDLAFLDSQRKWLEKARDKQVLPLDGWNLIVARSGRGWGKTEVGAQWSIRETGLYPGIVLHAVAPSHADLIGTMFNGISGVMSICPPELIDSTNFSAAIPTIKFKNGSLIRGFSAQSPERLRGPQASRVWGDEVAAWGPGAEPTLMNIDMSTRIAYVTPDGRRVQPQRFYTTTPKPLQWLAALLKKASIVINGSTYENKANLAEDFLREITQYEGTNIGRQEIHGELLDISEAAIIKQSWLRLWPHDKPLPHFEFIMVSLDTAFTERQFDKKSFEADPTCCQVWGIFSHERKWNMMLLEYWSDHVGMPELVRRAKKELTKTYGRSQTLLFKPLIGPEHHAEQIKRPDILLIEEKGSGISLRQMLAAEGIMSQAYNPGKADKLSRLHNISHIPARGRTWLPESANPKTPGQPRDWILPMLDELCVYSGPGTTKHDDVVDVFSMSHRYFADHWLEAGVTDDKASLIPRDGQTVRVPYEWLPEDMRGQDLPVEDDATRANYYAL
jgi:phage terminase large subunit-like protein